MKRLLMATALAVALSGTALAGNIPTGGAPDPGSGATQSSAVVAAILTVLNIVSK